MQVYVCMARSCWEEWPLSIHLTKPGAYHAGRQWLYNQCQGDRDAELEFGKMGSPAGAERGFQIKPFPLHHK